ncbi:hypothetical protein [Actinocorallia sp. A-T 12471]|uniref:hypothetical protein n=1 Tax=Actinocorallia sp. A-T 12471 TaxID=3089813 RepID=UPI0029CF38E5|nr:hypothetical protein [Actinocorallia sp. A-T 12471]MDX6739626.1 hypothetical protein [Actinocorallia sp. A-T 12471]
MNAAALSREARFPVSARKIRAPFVLDPSLCLYSPQENLESLRHPRIAAWIDFVRDVWTPTPVPGADAGRVAVLLPCTKYKPYVTSREHRGINAALRAAGWVPSGGEIPDGLTACLAEGEDPSLLDVSPLVRDGWVLDRFVVSEPLGIVPYELSCHWRGEQSPATSYDDPGLFESRGTSVSPYRDDSTATPGANGTWKWGPAEREAYADMHNALVDVLAAALGRLAPHYAGIAAWVSPGLTHISFLADASRRKADGLPSARKGLTGPKPLRGVLDVLPGALDLMPTRAQLTAATAALTERLAAEGRPAGPGSVRSVFARGDGRDTPLALPETLAHLTAWIDAAVAEGGS